MKKSIATIAGAVLALGLSAGPSSAADEVTLHEDAIAFCDSPNYNSPAVCDENVDNSHAVLREGGIRLRAANYNGYTSASFPLDATLSDVTDAAMVWTDTPGSPGGQPGIRVSGDFDGDGTRDTLWGESIYGGDWWLNGNSSQAVKDAAPSTTGGSGSQWHGTLAQWAEAFPDGEVDLGGYTLGVPADGTLASMTYAGTTYTFTNQDTVTYQRPTADAEIWAIAKNKARVTVKAYQSPGTEAKRGAFYRVQKVNPRNGNVHTVATGRVREGDRDRLRVAFPKSKKVMQVRVVSYGEVIAQRKIR